MIEVSNLKKVYSKKIVLNNLNFSIKKNKITALIGENGAGKSTALNIISRLINNDGGDIVIDQKNINDYHKLELAKKIAVLKQSNNIQAKIKIYDLISFGRYPHSQGNLNSEDYRIIDQAIEYLELEDIKDSFLDEVSGGQRQRALIAMIVAQDSEYILLDEPLNNLDMRHSTQIMKILKNLVEQLNKTIVIVIHDINYTVSYADEIIAFKNGSIIKKDIVENIMNVKTLESIFSFKVDIIEKNNYKFCQYYI